MADWKTVVKDGYVWHYYPDGRKVKVRPSDAASKGTGTANVPARPTAPAAPAAGPAASPSTAAAVAGTTASKPTWMLSPEQQAQLVTEGAGLPFDPANPDAVDPNYNPAEHLGINPTAALAQITAQQEYGKADAVLQGAKIEFDRVRQADQETNTMIARGLLNSSITTRDLQDVNAAATMRKQALTNGLALLTAQGAAEQKRIIGAASAVSQMARDQGIQNAHDAPVDPGTPAAAPPPASSTNTAAGSPSYQAPSQVKQPSTPAAGIGGWQASGMAQSAAKAVQKAKTPAKPKVKVSTNAWHPGISVSGY